MLPSKILKLRHRMLYSHIDGLVHICDKCIYVFQESSLKFHQTIFITIGLGV